MMSTILMTTPPNKSYENSGPNKFRNLVKLYTHSTLVIKGMKHLQLRPALNSAEEIPDHLTVSPLIRVVDRQLHAGLGFKTSWIQCQKKSQEY